MYYTVASHGQDVDKEMDALPREVENPARERDQSVVLIANDPLSYREAITTVLRELCAQCEVLTTGPEDLDLEVNRVDPGVVVCSRATPLVREKAFAWVELYPGGERLAVISIGGRCSTIPEIQLDDLLSVVDRGLNHAAA